MIFQQRGQAVVKGFLFSKKEKYYYKRVIIKLKRVFLKVRL